MLSLKSFFDFKYWHLFHFFTQILAFFFYILQEANEKKLYWICWYGVHEFKFYAELKVYVVIKNYLN